MWTRGGAATQLANTPASYSRTAAQATPEGLLRRLVPDQAASLREGSAVRSLLRMETQEVARNVAVERDDRPGSFEFRGKCVTFV